MCIRLSPGLSMVLVYTCLGMTFLFYTIRTLLICDNRRVLRVQKRPVIKNRNGGKPGPPKTATIKLEPTEPGQFVFVLGLEGTGHHMMQDFWKRCDRCIPIGKPTNDLYFLHTQKKTTEGIFATINSGNHLKQYKTLVTKMQALSNSNKGKMIIMNTFGEIKGNGMLSYPNFIDPHRWIQHPHALTLSGVAQEAGVAVKYVVLVRGAHEMVVSTTEHRKFGSKPGQTKILENMCRELEYTLLKMDDADFACIDYNDLSDTRLLQAGELLGFNGQTFSITMKALFHGHKSDGSHTKNNSLNLGEEASYMKSLTDCVEQTRARCATKQY